MSIRSLTRGSAILSVIHVVVRFGAFINRLLLRSIVFALTCIFARSAIATAGCCLAFYLREQKFFLKFFHKDK